MESNDSGIGSLHKYGTTDYMVEYDIEITMFTFQSLRGCAEVAFHVTRLGAFWMISVAAPVIVKKRHSYSTSIKTYYCYLLL